jgi:hypothetical protein
MFRGCSVIREKPQKIVIKAMNARLPTTPEVISTDPTETLSSGFLGVPKIAVAKRFEGRTERDWRNGFDSPVVVSLRDLV